MPLMLLTGCHEEGLPGPDERRVDVSALSHGMIELGEKLEDPYTVENMQEAVASLYPTRAGGVSIKATDLYVRFLPKTEEEYALLLSKGLKLTDHPVDYRIVKEGDYYHDPEISENAITWQYAVVSKDFEFPAGIRSEILDECYLSENDPVTRAESGIDWDAVEAEAYRLTGNADLYPATRGDEEAAAFPAGRITVEDPDAFGGKPYGLAGVQLQQLREVRHGLYGPRRLLPASQEVFIHPAVPAGLPQQRGFLHRSEPHPHPRVGFYAGDRTGRGRGCPYRCGVRRRAVAPGGREQRGV